MIYLIYRYSIEYVTVAPHLNHRGVAVPPAPRTHTFGKNSYLTAVMKIPVSLFLAGSLSGFKWVQGLQLVQILTTVIIKSKLLSYYIKYKRNNNSSY